MGCCVSCRIIIHLDRNLLQDPTKTMHKLSFFTSFSKGGRNLRSHLFCNGCSTKSRHKLWGFLSYECEVIAVICLSHMQLCSSIKKKWDFRSKNMGENWDQRCYVEWGLWHFREVQKLLVPRNTTRKRSGVFFWRIIRLQLSLQSWYMRRKKEMS